MPAVFTTLGTSSFIEFLGAAAPELLPGNRVMPAGLDAAELAPHGTTIVSLSYDGGVLMAGDRRSTMGNQIANRDVRKVFPTDEYSVVGIAGTAGIAVELVRLFGVDLEHSEKMEGATLSLEGKANKLSTLIRSNLGAAMQGLAVIPLFAGIDPDAAEPGRSGRIYSYDVTGGRNVEPRYFSIGSGSVFAKGALKKRYTDDLGREGAIRVALEALYDAADDDTATGGPDVLRRIFPIVYTVDAEGVREVPEDEISTLADAVVEGRRTNLGG